MINARHSSSVCGSVLGWVLVACGDPVVGVDACVSAAFVSVIVAGAVTEGLFITVVGAGVLAPQADRINAPTRTIKVRKNENLFITTPLYLDLLLLNRNEYHYSNISQLTV